MVGKHSFPIPGSRRTHFYSLRSKILISFGLLFVVTISLVSLVRTFGIPFTPFLGSYGRERDQTFNALGLVADLKKERLAFWLAEKKADARVLADTSLVELGVARVREIIEEQQRGGKKPEQWKAELEEQDSYRGLVEHLQLVLRTYSAYHKIQVADAQTGLILVSTDDRDLGKQIGDRRALVNAGLSAQGIAVEVSKSSSDEKPYMIICAAIRNRSSTAQDGETTLAVLLLYVDTDEFVKPLMYAGEGLGKTGDIVLVNQDRRILVQPRYPLADGTWPKVLEHQIEAAPALLAAERHDGVILAEDYRGVPVLAAYRSILVTPDTSWGLVVKRDKAEVFGPIWQLLTYSLMVAVAGMLAFLILAFLIAGRVSRPVSNLSSTAREVEAGNLNVRAKVERVDEVGSLALAFNSMIQRVQNWHTDLEDQVRSRTAELAQERERLAITLRSIGDGVISTDTDGKILSLNNAAEELTGWPETEALGRPVEEVFHIVNEKTRERCENPVRKVLLHGRIVGLANDTVLISRNGAERVLADSGAPIRGSDGSIIGVVLVFRDVTERKRALEAVLQSEQLLRGILVASPVGICLTQERIITWANDTFVKMFGFKHESEYLGRPTSILHPSEEEYLTVRKAVYADLDGKQRGEAYTQFRHNNGSLFHGHLQVTHLDPLDPTRGTISAITDISEQRLVEAALRESEQKYRTLFEESLDPRFVVDFDGTLLEANQALLDLFGHTRGELIGQSVLKTYADPADRERYRSEINRKGFAKDYALKLRTKEGREIDCLFTASVLRDKLGNIVGHRGSIRDITAQKALERQLVQAQKMEAVGTLAGGMAHDFNNLLQVISGYSELLLADRATLPPLRDDLNKIHSAARSGAELVQRLLTFSRKTEITPHPMNLNREIEQVHQFLTRTIPKMIEIEMVLEKDLAAINADRMQIEQIIMNLSVNARDAMPQGGKLSIKTQNVVLDEEYCKTHLGCEPGPYVMLSVSDTGTGMDKDTCEHIFEPFFTTKEPGEGTGLGLAMVYGIVKQHGGYIMCYSEPNKGTTFSIYFPSLVPDEKDEAPAVGSFPPGGTETILLVDDEEFIRDLGERILKRAGYSVLTASNGRQALEIYEKERDNIALVILDLIMPEMGGMECLEHILTLNANARVLVASGFALDRPARDALALGARGFVGKPYAVAKVLQTVRDALDAA